MISLYHLFEAKNQNKTEQKFSDAKSNLEITKAKISDMNSKNAAMQHKFNADNLAKENQELKNNLVQTQQQLQQTSKQLALTQPKDTVVDPKHIVNYRAML